MKRIAIFRSIENGIVTHLQIIPESKTENDLKDLTEKFNSTNEYSKVEVENISDSVYEAFKFCLGDSLYKRFKTVSDLCDNLTSLKEDLKEIYESVDSLSSEVDFTLRNVEKFLKEE